jgi:hypothetical protein
VVSKRSQRRKRPDPTIRHGTLYAYRHGCSCPECRERIRRLNESARERNKQREAPSHGTEYIYNAYSCRCDACRTAAANARAERKARNYSTRIPAGAHGKVETYRTWGCRCLKCKQAASDDRRLKRIDAGLPVRPVTLVAEHSKVPRAGAPRPMAKVPPAGACEVCGKIGFDFLGGRRCYAHRPGGMMGTLV